MRTDIRPLNDPNLAISTTTAFGIVGIVNPNALNTCLEGELGVSKLRTE
jgi:hypothetical protein